MQNSGLSFSNFSSITAISVSARKYILSFLIFNLSALNFICSNDSSPEIYNIFPSYPIKLQSCNIKVDFPIPGSPPINVNEPSTNPPPRTLSISSNPLETLVYSFFFASFSLTISELVFP